MSLTLTFWFSYDQLLHRQRPAQLTIHQGVLQLLTLVAPYLGSAQLTFYRDCQAISAAMLAQQQAEP
jgi:hypothetical protein